jgi:hypothetical protein
MGGLFMTTGSTVVNHRARWDGTAWAPVGGGTNDRVHSMLSLNGTLLVAGQFTAAGAVAAARAARSPRDASELCSRRPCLGRQTLGRRAAINVAAPVPCIQDALVHRHGPDTRASVRRRSVEPAALPVRELLHDVSQERAVHRIESAANDQPPQIADAAKTAKRQHGHSAYRAPEATAISCVASPSQACKRIGDCLVHVQTSRYEPIT